jgi:hypothetical protein
VLPVDDEHTQFILAAHSGDVVEGLNLPADAGGLELAQANALVAVEPGQQVEIGDVVSCWILDG